MQKLVFNAILFTGCLAITSAYQAYGQFNIKVPKLPKIVKEQPQRPAEPEQPATGARTGGATSTSSSSSAGGEVRGKPIPNAKITFSNNPDGSNPKTTFTSSEFIYGRLDLGGRTVYDAFGLKNQTDVPIYYISYDVVIYKPGSKPYEGNWGSVRNFVLVSKEDAQKTYWNFDVLPDPAKISTIKSQLADEKDFGAQSIAGIYSKWYNANSARSTFPQNGTYTIDVTIWGDSYDDWGQSTRKMDEYPTASAQFAFQFSGTDGQTLIANREKALATLEASKNRREMLTAMPEWWAKGWTPTDPKLAPARLVPMIKNYIGGWNLTYIKHMIWPVSGPVWVVENNDLGIPRYRRFTSAIYIIYRDPKDNSCKLGYLEMHEPYSGGGTYAAPVLNGISDVKLIDCAAVR